MKEEVGSIYRIEESIKKILNVYLFKMKKTCQITQNKHSNKKKVLCFFLCFLFLILNVKHFTFIFYFIRRISSYVFILS